MDRYVALIDGEAGVYGVDVPDLPGCTAMGRTVEEALEAAVEAAQDWAEVVIETGGSVPPPRSVEALRGDPDVRDALAQGAILASIALVRRVGKPVKANLSLDAGVLAALDAEARRAGLSRSGLVEALTKRLAAGTI